MKNRFFQTLGAIMFLCAASIPVFGQADVSSATIKGKVTDPQAAVIPGATVTITSIDQGTTRMTVTDETGEFQLRLVRPGVHDLTVEAPGFQLYSLKGVQLTVGQTANLDIKLQLAGVKAEMVVTMDTPLIEIERTQQANTIETNQVENLPNIGRAFTAYVYTLPGVANSNAPRVQGAGRFSGFASSGFSIGGSNGRNNLVTVDGGENEYGSGQLRFGISPEAIQEFQVNRNSFSAEFGFTAGTAVNVILKSGSNSFHGSVYVFYRSQKTSARDPFDFNVEKPFDQQVYPGFSFGGPVVENKLFFFTNYEREKNDIARFRTYTESGLLQPTAPQLSLLAQLDASADANVRRISANLRNALTTNASTYPVTYGILQDNEGTFNGFARLNTWNTRVDYQASARDSVSGRFTLTRNYTDDPGTNNVISPSNRNDLTYRDYSTVVTWTHSFGSNLMSQARGQFSPNNSSNTAPPEDPRVTVVMSGLGTFGRNFGSPYVVTQNRYQFEDSLTWTRGSHTLKFGASYRPVQYTFRNDLWFAGEYQFLPNIYPVTLAVPPADQATFVAAAGAGIPLLTSLQSFNRNLPFLYRQGFNNPRWVGTGHYVGVFAQDSWKVHPRLTLDLGGRVDYDGEPAPVPHHTYFSPRFGFAWDLMGDHKTVLRGGSGVFYSPIYLQIPGYTSVLNGSGRYINQIARSSTAAAAVYQAGIAQSKYPFSIMTEADINALGISTAAGAPGRVLFELDPDYENNYSIQANLGIQREISTNLSIEVAYQMYHGLHIQMPVGLNYIEADPQPAGRNPALGPFYRVCQVADNCRRVSDPGITQFTNYESRGSSIYHGMTLSFARRFSDHFSFQSNYTFSKAIDDQTDFNSAFAPPFPTRLFTERSLSAFDIRHNFVFSGVFQTPFHAGAGQPFLARVFADMSLSPIVFIRTGIPFSLLTGTDINGDTRGGTDRLFYIGRNTGIGPDFHSVNLRISKAFRFKADSDMRLEFSADGSNLFNHTNFAAVREIIGADPAAPDYHSGTVRLTGQRNRDFRRGDPLSFTSAFNPRQILFGLKLAF